jgi:nucleotide-binding universal stress UspA family protein
MKKIIAAFDGLRYSSSTRDYAIHFCKETKAHLVGVFLDDIMRTSYRLTDLGSQEGPADSRIGRLNKKDQQMRDASASDFMIKVKEEGLHFSLHHDYNVAIRELLHETIYADMLVVDGHETLTSYTEPLPTAFIRDLLSHAQCPVVVVPARFKPVSRLVWLFDGEPASVHAMKMFCYVLPELLHHPLEVVSIKPSGKSDHVPDNKLVREWLKRHAPQATFTVLKGDPETEIPSYLKTLKEQPLVVLGAYRRNTVSRWFRPSMADNLIRNLKLPVFIAHNK